MIDIDIDIDRSRAKDWAALDAWRNLYKSGIRLTYNGEKFQVYQCHWAPGRRVETEGHYNIFDCTRIEPTPAIYEIVRQHMERMIKMFPKGVPADLEDRFYHLLSQPELYTLQVECERRGIYCIGVPMDGGNFPTIITHIADEKISPKEVKAKFDPGKVKEPEIGPLGNEYIDGFGEIAQRYWDKPTYSQDHGTQAARDRRAAESRAAVEESEAKRKGIKNHATN